MIPQATEICHSLLHADLVAFHIDRYKQNFISSCEELLNIKMNEDNISYLGRPIKIRAIPFGIDPQKFFDGLDSPETLQYLEQLNEKYKGKTLIIGVDRIDYIKGIEHKLRGLEIFLESCEKGDVVFEQIGVPSREIIDNYKNYEKNVSQKCDEINERFGPVVVYRHHEVDFNYLVALYRRADACVVSSMSDGMNLVSFEYVAAQRNGHGLLLLSKFAGCCSLFNTPLLINPIDYDKFSQNMKEALELPIEKKKEIQSELLKVVMNNTSEHWTRSFFTEMGFKLNQPI